LNTTAVGGSSEKIYSRTAAYFRIILAPTVVFSSSIIFSMVRFCSQWRCSGQGPIAPPPNFSLSKVQNLWLKIPHFWVRGFYEQFWAPIICLVGNLQLSIRKLQLCAPFFLNAGRRCLLVVKEMPLIWYGYNSGLIIRLFETLLAAMLNLSSKTNDSALPQNI